MTPLEPITEEGIITELSFQHYISDEEEQRKIIETCKNVLNAQIEKTYDQKEQIACTLNFIKALWDKYDCGRIADIYSNFIKIEEALYGLERKEESGEGYRDHFVHMFNTFIFGLRIISSLLNKLDDPKAKYLFKVEDEKLKEKGVPFKRNYSYKERIFYLWTLIATFHDIAIPFQHLTKIGKGINEFVQEFGWIFTDPSVSMRNFDSSQLYHYLCLLSSIYGGGLQLEDEGRKYHKTTKPQYYLVKILGREFDSRNHGVLSGFFMAKIIEEIFLLDRSAKYQFTFDEFNKYAEYILEEDIARSALAISLHSMREETKKPKIFPIEFRNFPLTFLLILSDELQEYLRWEGTSIIRGMKFNYQPILKVEVENENLYISNIKLKTLFSLDEGQKGYIIEQARAISKKSGVNREIENIDVACEIVGNIVKENLEKKLNLGKYFKLELEIYLNWDRKLYGKELSTIK